jgi:hypothetical protein
MSLDSRAAWPKRCLFRLLSILIGLVLSLVPAELLIRWLRPQETLYTGKGLYQFDPDVGHVLRPNIDRPDVKTNSYGFRDREYSPTKPNNSFRIVGLGDSFTFGSVYPDGIYLEVLERLFEERNSAIPVEVINTGVPNYNTIQELKHFKKFGAKFDPDLIILGLFISGDILENRETLVFTVVDGELTNPHEAPKTWQRLLLHSHVYRLLRGLLQPTARAEDLKQSPHRLGDFVHIEHARLQVCRKTADSTMRGAYRITFDVLLELRNTLRALGIPLLVLVIPDEIQVSPSVFQSVMQVYSLKKGEFDLDKPNRRLKRFCQHNEIWCVDVLRELRLRNKIEPVYIFENTHWNEVACRIAAESLYRFLINRVDHLRNARDS